MTTSTQLKVAFIVSFLFSCNSQSLDTSVDHLKYDNNDEKNFTSFCQPRSFVKNYGINDNTRLFTFVGEKISVEPLPHQQGSRDNGFKAKYIILQKVFGDFPEDTIEFVAYDHYGSPDFSKFKNVLLFVSADSGTYYHQKYLYNDVYKTKSGRWAGPYSSEDYRHAYNKHTKIKPMKIEFGEKVSFPIEMIDEEGRQIRFSYPKPYFKTAGDSALAVYGNYVEELFTLRKTGILTARGLFDATAEQEEDMVEASQPEPRITPPTSGNLKFLAFWKEFIASLKEPELRNFRKIALDTLYVCGQLLPADKFIDKCFDQVIDDEVRRRIVDSTKLEYTSSEVEFYNLLTSQVKKEIMKAGENYRLRKMLVTRSTKNNNPPTIYFVFIESKKGYRLYEIGHHWFKECCR